MALPDGPRDARVPGRQARGRRAGARVRDARAGRGDRLPRRANGRAPACCTTRSPIRPKASRSGSRAASQPASASSTPASSSTSSSASVDELEARGAPRRADRCQDADRPAVAAELARRPLAVAVGHRALDAAVPIMAAMKVLNLRCGQQHRFEGWFASEDDFVSQQASAASSRARCAPTPQVMRLPSAPRLNVSRQRGARRAAAARRGDRDDAAGAVAARRAPGA